MFDGLVKFYQVMCCETCKEILHYNFDCPECGKMHIKSSIYSTFSEHLKNRGNNFSCESCGALYSLIAQNEFDKNTWKVKQIK